MKNTTKITVTTEKVSFFHSTSYLLSSPSFTCQYETSIEQVVHSENRKPCSKHKNNLTHKGGKDVLLQAQAPSTSWA